MVIIRIIAVVFGLFVVVGGVLVVIGVVDVDWVLGIFWVVCAVGIVGAVVAAIDKADSGHGSSHSDSTGREVGVEFDDFDFDTDDVGD